MQRTTFLRQGDVVWTPFPFVELGISKSRPALIISSQPLGPNGNLFWAVMITSAARREWAGDIPLEDLVRADLPIPSRIRTAKMATLEIRLARLIGDVSDALIAAVLDQVQLPLRRDRRD